MKREFKKNPYYLNLNEYLDYNVLHNSWKNYVRYQMRDVPVIDLFDNYDFHLESKKYLNNLLNTIYAGNYKTSHFFTFRVEKKDGGNRTIILPDPIDAILLDALFSKFHDKVKNEFPSKNSFWSRDRTKNYKSYKDDYGSLNIYRSSRYNLWYMIQIKINEYLKSSKYILTTDISDYYNSIELSNLKSEGEKVQAMNSVFWNLYFNILYNFSGSRDYLSHTEVGLPIINYEGVRFLANINLFGIDRYLKRKTGDRFIRWMDDIFVPVNSKAEADDILKGLSKELKKKKLTLNPNKTKLIKKIDFDLEFFPEYHEKLNNFEKSKSSRKNTERSGEKDISNKLLNFHQKEALLDFKYFFKSKKGKAWDKIIKRYITLFGRLNDNSLLPFIFELYTTEPDLRRHLSYYLSILDYQKGTSELLLSIVSKFKKKDDVSIFYLCKTIVDWKIPSTEKDLSFVKTFLKKLELIKGDSMSFYNHLLVMAKYSNEDELLNFILENKNYWYYNPFICRQVCAVLSRLILFNPSMVIGLLKELSELEFKNVRTICNYILNSMSNESIAGKKKLYLFPPITLNQYYPISKFLNLCTVLNSELIRKDPSLSKKLSLSIQDPMYMYWIHKTYGI